MSDLFSVLDKTVLVTGGTHGIGRAIAGGLVAAGARVYVNSRSAGECASVAEELSAKGFCVGLPADIATEDGCVQLAADLTAREPALNVLVNNAGSAWAAPVGEFPAEAWDSVLAVSLRAPMLLTRELVPALTAAGTPEDPARIVNIGSADALRVPEFPTYSAAASKAAIHHITRMVAQELAPSVTANVIAPGTFPSRMTADALAAFGDEIAACTPLRRIGREDDLVGAVQFLCSRAGSYVTGAVLPVDGGLATCRLGFVPPEYADTEG
ncbi:SDR family oxidoreductase [Amycolatopsis minnesotensis]|uniref:SDR family oxidoreductase n=1 Tax=Amycolatopsis minnesotensis TaxID=337894 RepID=A0ABP5BXD9_9PSEU